MDTSLTVILLSIAGAALGIMFRTIWVLIHKIKNSKHMTLVNKRNEHITVSTQYNREDSRRLLEFIK